MSVLLKYSSEFNINLNAQDEAGYTGFHVACREGFQKIVELIMKSSETVDINLNAKSNTIGYTGFNLACLNGNGKLADMIIRNSKNFSIDIGS